MVIFTFELRRKSGNKSLRNGNEMINANDRMHYAVQSTITKHLRKLGAAAVKDIHQELFNEDNKCSVIVTVHPPTKHRMDAPNWYPTVKAIIDGFTDAGLWSDDNDNIVKTFTFKSGDITSNNKYKLEIEIRED